MGASLLFEGKYEASIEAFSQALNHAKKCISTVESIELSFNQLGIHSVSICNEDTRLNLFGDQFNVYSKVIVFSPDLRQASLCSANLFFILAIISFNIGLSHHCCGMKRCKSLHLPEAANFYEIAFELVDEVALFSDIPAQLMLTASNNISHIHFELEERERHETSLDFLNLLIDAIQSRDSTGAIVNDEDIQDFTFNTCYRSQPFAAATA